MYKSASLAVSYKVTREACEHQFSLNKTVKASGGGMSDPASDVAERLMWAKQLVRAHVTNPELRLRDFMDTAAGKGLTNARRYICFCDDAIPCQRCPSCGYVQSWMQQHWPPFGHWVSLISLGIPALAVGLCASLFGLPSAGTQKLLAVCAYVAGFIVLVRLLEKPLKPLMVPNKKWSKSHGGTKPKGNMPSISP